MTPGFRLYACHPESRRLQKVVSPTLGTLFKVFEASRGPAHSPLTRVKCGGWGADPPPAGAPLGDVQRPLTPCKPSIKTPGTRVWPSNPLQTFY